MSELNENQITDKIIEILNHDGGPAYPNNFEINNIKQIYPGMRLRDWFAGMVLQGWAANGEVKIELKENGPFGNMAGWCYHVADAMLEARNKED